MRFSCQQQLLTLNSGFLDLICRSEYHDILLRAKLNEEDRYV